jgi:hypothetical protein
MLRIRRFLFFLVLWLFCSHGIAQTNVIFKSETKADIPVTFVNSPKAAEITTNYYIGEIARCAQKKIEFTQYNYSFKEVFRIIEDQANHYTATLEFEDFNCTGDVSYRGFSISDALVPDFGSTRFQVYGTQAAALVDQQIKAAALQPGYSKLGAFPFIDTNKIKSYKVQMSQPEFSFDASSIDRFTAKLKLIDDYFLAGPLINGYFQKLRAIDFSNTDMIIVYDINLKEVEKDFDKLYQNDFPGKLHLSSKDPAKLLDKINLFSDTLFILRKQMNEKLSSLDKIYYNKGKDDLNHGKIAAAESDFERSVLYNSNFAPAHFELAKISYQRDSLFTASNTLAFILQKLNPDAALQKEILSFTDTVYKKMIAVGQEYVRTEKFNEAIELFEHCIKFCSDLPGYKCPDKQEKGLAGARFGIYQSYLNVSQRALDNGRPDLAAVYIQEALKYQKLNSNDIISGDEARQKLEKVLNVYISRSDTLNNRQNYDKALFYLDMVAKMADSNQITLPGKYYQSLSKSRTGIYKNMLKKSRQELSSGNTELSADLLEKATAFQAKNSHDVTLSPEADSLLMKLEGVKYKDKIRKGIQYCSVQEYGLALKYFDEARVIENKINLKPDARLDSLIPAAARPVILLQIDAADKLGSLFMIDSSEAVKASLLKNQKTHMLAFDTAINRSISILSNHLLSAKCKYQNTRFDSIYTKATYNILRQDYLAADEQLSLAIAISEKYRECNVDATAAIADKKLYLKNASYQRLMQKANAAFSAKNFNDYFYYYKEAENYYNLNQLFNTGMTHSNLVDLASSSGDTVFIIKAFDYLTSINKFEAALSCLKSLEKLGYPSLSAKGIQQQLGVKMALRDHEQNLSNKPSLMVMNYTAGDKWLKYFRAAYLGTWRSVR